MGEEKPQHSSHNKSQLTDIVPVNSKNTKFMMKKMVVEPAAIY